MYLTQEFEAQGRVRIVRIGILMLTDVMKHGCCTCTQQMPDDMHRNLQLLHVLFQHT
jgi:hypothetical protein